MMRKKLALLYELTGHWGNITIGSVLIPMHLKDY